MKFSFFCQKCKVHLSKGDHTQCKKQLREEHRREMSEARRLTLGENARKRYAKAPQESAKFFREREEFLQSGAGAHSIGRDKDTEGK